MFPIINLAVFTALCGITGYISFQVSSSANPPFGATNQTSTRYSRVSDSGSWPEYSVDIFSRISFAWMDDLIVLATSRPLLASDLWNLDEHDKGEYIYSKFSRNAYVKGSLLKLLIRLNYKILAYEYGISLIDHVFIFGGPFFINAILKAIESPNVEFFDVLKPVMGLLVASLLRTTCESQLYWVNRRIDVRIRASLVGAIYMKGLKRMQPIASHSSDPRKEYDSYADGAVSNLMSADTDKILACFRQSHYLLSVPFLLILCCGLLVSSVGWAGTIAGMLSLSLAVPVTKTVGKMIKKHRKELMQKTDERVSKLNEILNGIRTIKLFAWESHFRNEVDAARSTELESLESYLNSNMLTQLIWRCSPLLASGVTFLVRAWVSSDGEYVDAATAFTVLAMYNNVLRYPLFVIPKLAISVMELNVSLGRIEGFFMEPDLERVSQNLSNIVRNGSISDPSESIDCGFSDKASFNFGGTEAPILKDLDFMFPKGKLTSIFGKSGTGKSSLLLALLGEMKTLNGRVITPANVPQPNGKNHPVSYVSQTPYLINSTIKENILFGNPYISERYSQVLFACALIPDLESLPGGDSALVGERGSTLSGGQRQRICLARAVYATSKVILMDDVLSAVDANTADHILKNCLLKCGKGELMEERTRVLVTHAIDKCLPVSDYVCIMGSHERVGKVVATGSVEEVMDMAKKSSNIQDALNAAFGSEFLCQRPGGKIAAQGSSAVSVPQNASITPKPKTKPPKEDLSSGKPSLDAYKFYLSSAGGLHSGIMFLVSIIVAYSFGFLHDYFLKLWSDKSKTPNQESAGSSLILYSGSVVLAILALYARFRYQVYFSARASKTIYEMTFSRLLQAPLSFFDSTPSGKIMNRFGKDTQVLDQEVSSSIGETVQQFVHGITVATMISFASPVLILFAIPIGILYVPIAKKFMSITRSLKRLESSTRSPVYSAFGETLSGAVTIRAFGKTEQHLSHLLKTVDANHAAFLPLWGANRWLAFRVESVGALVAFGTGLSIAFAATGKTGSVFGSRIDPGWAGLVLNYAGMFTDVLTWLVRNSAQMEMTMTSVERLQEYTHLDQESCAVAPDFQIPESWPSPASIVFENLAIKYTRDAPFALDLPGIVEIRPGESIGIVGRTGSGKSTLGMSFMRFVEYSRGTILIDGFDCSRIPLRDLREKIVIIPQDPFLFRGTVRSNLDPTSAFTDAELQEALAFVSREELEIRQPLEFDSPISENGANLSGGQKQILSLARGVLRKLKKSRGAGGQGGLIVMDESTASLDNDSDKWMQSTIQRMINGGDENPCGPKWTCVMIAHRLKSVLDLDRVLVLSEGKIIQDGNPRQLLKMGDGPFWQLCRYAGETASNN
ncbi:P-loop containing nucleoside triphosphate hydrolase protein [Obelidium mucronatum]|nr:P-loop containing nucleoside triphosphate hydrolase protein [Obelidium mucronatum]